MNKTTRPEIKDFKFKITSRDQRIAFDSIWKEIVKEDRALQKETNRSYFAPLSILRNLMLDRDMHTGFTPSYKINRISSGMGFNYGFANAYDALERAPRFDKILKGYIERMLSAVDKGITSTLDIPKAGTFDTAWYTKSYCAGVNKMLIDHDYGDIDIRGNSMSELYDIYDKYNETDGIISLAS